MAPRNGIERWRGEVTAHLENIAKRLDEIAEQFNAALTVHTAEDKEQFVDLDKRVRVTETSQAKLASKVALGAGLIGAVAAALGDAALRKLIG